jgi:hypothetical protein
MKRLTQARREQARHRAEKIILKRIGPAPERVQFKDRAQSRYPSSIRQAIYGMMLIPLASWFLLSAMRLYAIGAANAGTTSLLGVVSQRRVAGLAVVLGAEISQILFTVAFRVLGRKAAFVGGMVLATSVALVGNIQYQLWGQPFTAFLVLETVSAPLVVLLLGEVLALLWLESARVEHEETLLFEQALSDWDEQTAHPADHPDWWNIYPLVLRDELAKHNRKSVDDLTDDQWFDLVKAEINAENRWNADEFSLNSANSRHDGRTQIQVALDYFERNPHVFERLQQQTISQSEVAYKANVSQSTVCRAMKAARNGHENGEHDEG